MICFQPLNSNVFLLQCWQIIWMLSNRLRSPAQLKWSCHIMTVTVSPTEGLREGSRKKGAFQERKRTFKEPTVNGENAAFFSLRSHNFKHWLSLWKFSIQMQIQRAQISCCWNESLCKNWGDDIFVLFGVLSRSRQIFNIPPALIFLLLFFKALLLLKISVSLKKDSCREENTAFFSSSLLINSKPVITVQVHYDHVYSK